MINLNHLRSFYICALYKNVTKAAKSLDVTQPSLSQQIKAFEEEVGFDIFYRNGRSFDLTPKGMDLFLRAEPVFSSVKGVMDFVENQNPLIGEVSIGVTDQIERPFVAKIIAHLTKEAIFRNSKFSVTSDQFDSLHRNFSNSKFNILLSHKKIRNQIPNFTFQFPVKIVSNKGNFEVSRVRQSNVQSLLSGLGQRLVLPSSGLLFRNEIDDFLSGKEVNSEIIFESNILACLSESIRSGLGCGFLPVPYVFEDFKKERLSIYGPEEGFWKHKIYLYSPVTDSNVIVDEFIKVIQHFTLKKGG